MNSPFPHGSLRNRSQQKHSMPWRQAKLRRKAVKDSRRQKRLFLLHCSTIWPAIGRVVNVSNTPWMLSPVSLTHGPLIQQSFTDVVGSCQETVASIEPTSALSFPTLSSCPASPARVSRLSSAFRHIRIRNVARSLGVKGRGCSKEQAEAPSTLPLCRHV